MIEADPARPPEEDLATKKEKIERLGEVELFSDLSKKDLDRIVENAKEVTHTAGQSIVTDGQVGAGFHLILEGKASVFRGGRTVATLGPGDYFGEMALIDGGRRTATVRAETDIVTLFLAQWGFKPLVRDNAQMAWKLLVHLTKRLRAEQRDHASHSH
jgi:CRP-like cAMP-binding protein